MPLNIPLTTVESVDSTSTITKITKQRKRIEKKNSQIHKKKNILRFISFNFFY